MAQADAQRLFGRPTHAARRFLSDAEARPGALPSERRRSPLADHRRDQRPGAREREGGRAGHDALKRPVLHRTEEGEDSEHEESEDRQSAQVVHRLLRDRAGSSGGLYPPPVTGARAPDDYRRDRPSGLSFTSPTGSLSSVREPTDEHQFLEAGLANLLPLLAAHGFSRVDSAGGVSSAGPFAAVTLRRGTIELGLIVRDRVRLGCPNYSAGGGYVGHTEVLKALDPERRPALVEDAWFHFKATDGGDPFEALLADLSEVVLPAIANDEERFRRILADAFRRRMASWGVPGYEGRGA